MTSTLVLVRARLRRDLSAGALAHLLVPEGKGAEIAASHHLVWALFADAPERRRDFLWRRTRLGEFLILARRAPSDPHGLFELEHKEFAPLLHRGQRLGFDLRANPVVADPPVAAGRRGRRRDVITQAISHLPSEPDPDRRRSARTRAAHEAAAAWLARQATASGFTLGTAADALAIDGEDWVRIPRDHGATITFLALTFRGVLTVEDPGHFLVALAHGFGAAKAFGCGLMLIRRG